MKTANNLYSTFLCAAIILAVEIGVANADVYVITNGADITSTDLRDIFIGEKQFAGGAKLIPVDNSAAQVEFLTKVMKWDANKYNAAWTKKSFRDGVNPPTVKSSDAEIVSFVKSTPGAVGYVSSEPKDVKVVVKF